MLVLSRKPGEKIRIGSGITITVVGVQGNKIRLGIDAPEDVPILRSELNDFFLESIGAGRKRERAMPTLALVD
jgi:carbon storage regulator